MLSVTYDLSVICVFSESELGMIVLSQSVLLGLLQHDLIFPFIQLEQQNTISVMGRGGCEVYIGLSVEGIGVPIHLLHVLVKTACLVLLPAVLLHTLLGFEVHLPIVWIFLQLLLFKCVIVLYKKTACTL